jgi:CubicO group peptidase (beta-lactamase class C family)
MISFSIVLAALLTSPPPPALPPRLEGEGEAMIEILDAFAGRDEFSGVALVARGGEVLARRAYGLAQREPRVEMTTDTRLRIASLSKTFCALAVLRLVDRGEIALTESASTYLPELRHDYTVEQLLSHRAGLYRDTLTATERTREEHFTTAELVELIAAQELLHRPGERHAYSSPGYVLLAAIVERVTEQSYASALRELVLVPLGLDDTGIDTTGLEIPRKATRYQRLVDEIVEAPVQDVSFAPGAGDVYTTVDDLWTLARALQSDGFLSADMRSAMATDQGSNYGFGVRCLTYVSAAEPEPVNRMISHDGGTSGVASEWRVFLDDEVVVVVLCNLTEMDVGGVANRIGNVALGLSADLPRPSRKREALRLLLELDTDQALVKLREFDRADQPSRGELFRLAEGYHLQGRADEARQVATFLGRIWSTSEYPWILLGMIEQPHDLELSLSHYGRALRANPRSLTARRGVKRVEGLLAGD